MVYSITDRNSFDNIRMIDIYNIGKWMKQINEKIHPAVRKIVIGNKSDSTASR